MTFSRDNSNKLDKALDTILGPFTPYSCGDANCICDPEELVKEVSKKTLFVITLDDNATVLSIIRILNMFSGFTAAMIGVSVYLFNKAQEKGDIGEMVWVGLLFIVCNIGWLLSDRLICLNYSKTGGQSLVLIKVLKQDDEANP